MRRIGKTSIGWFAAVVLVVAGCANAPTKQMTESRSALRAAEEMGGNESPKAAYHLELAREQITKAQPLMDEGRSEKRLAREYLERAELDAELALIYARTRQVQNEAKQAWAEVDSLQSEVTP